MTSKSELKRLAVQDPLGTAQMLAVAIEALEHFKECGHRDSLWCNRVRCKGRITPKQALDKIRGEK